MRLLFIQIKVVEQTLKKQVGLMLLATLFFSLLYSIAVVKSLELLDIESEWWQQYSFWNKLVRESFGALLIFLIWSAIYLLYHYILRSSKEAIERVKAEKELEIQKLEYEKLNMQCLHQAADLEMQSLRLQMNPHFIFNSLNSINCFILENDKESASEYLTKFSRLIRLILENSKTSLVALEREIEALRLYIELEALRFNNCFDSEINISSCLDAETILVPPLIIQPYVENSIWHGLLHKKGKGHLIIEVFISDGRICYKILDNGIGRAKAMELRSKPVSQHKPMGMRITAERIGLQQHDAATIEIIDLVSVDGAAMGTEVLIRIPLRQQIIEL